MANVAHAQATEQGAQQVSAVVRRAGPVRKSLSRMIETEIIANQL